MGKTVCDGDDLVSEPDLTGLETPRGGNSAAEEVVVPNSSKGADKVDASRATLVRGGAGCEDVMPDSPRGGDTDDASRATLARGDASCDSQGASLPIRMEGSTQLAAYRATADPPIHQEGGERTADRATVDPPIQQEGGEQTAEPPRCGPPPLGICMLDLSGKSYCIDTGRF